MPILLREATRDNQVARVQHIISTHMDRAEGAPNPSMRAWHELKADAWLARLDRLNRRGGDAR